MTNVNSQTTADFWDAYITAADVNSHVDLPAKAVSEKEAAADSGASSSPTEWDESVRDDDHVCTR